MIMNETDALIHSISLQEFLETGNPITIPAGMVPINKIFNFCQSEVNLLSVKTILESVIIELSMSQPTTFDGVLSNYYRSQGIVHVPIRAALEVHNDVTILEQRLFWVGDKTGRKNPKFTTFAGLINNHECEEFSTAFYEVNILSILLKLHRFNEVTLPLIAQYPLKDINMFSPLEEVYHYPHLSMTIRDPNALDYFLSQMDQGIVHGKLSYLWSFLVPLRLKDIPMAKVLVKHQIQVCQANQENLGVCKDGYVNLNYVLPSSNINNNYLWRSLVPFRLVHLNVADVLMKNLVRIPYELIDEFI